MIINSAAECVGDDEKMIKQTYKPATVAIVSALAVLFGGCTAAPEVVRPTLQTAAVKSGNTYVIRRAAVHTPAADRAWQTRSAEQPPATSRVNNTPHNTAQASNAEAQKVLQQQQRLRAQYHARYQAKKQAKQQSAQLAAAQRQQSVAAQANRKAPVTPLTPLAARSPIVTAANAVNTARKTPAPAKKPAGQSAALSKKQFYLERWQRQQEEKRLEAKKAEQRVERVIHTAKKQIGTRYVWGGASPKTGFDCSGLVQHSIKTGADVKVPRTAAQQYKVAVKVPGNEASRGDLIFFKTTGNAVNHVGIYLGDNKFVHAPRTGRKITTSKLSAYWKQRFVSFGRIPGACKVPV